MLLSGFLSHFTPSKLKDIINIQLMDREMAGPEQQPFLAM